MTSSIKFFLHNLRTNLKPNPEVIFIIITGNESCDLDSIVSAIGYAYLKTRIQSGSGVIYIPYCNILKDDLDLRPEVMYWLRTVGLNKGDLFNVGELDWLLKADSSKEIQLILVDHLQVEQSSLFRDCPVLEIIDHRPLPNNFKQPDSCTYFNVHVVGSCSTLITELLFEGLDLSEIPKDLCHLLYGAVLIDNDGFSKFAIEIKKATERDQLAFEKLVKQSGEALLNQGMRSNDIYEKIKMAKFDISGLSLLDLFRRDCKKVIIQDYPTIVCSTITGVDCQELPRMPGFYDEASVYCVRQCAHALVCVTVGRIPHSGTSCVGCSPKEAFLADGTRRGIVVTAPPRHLDFANKLWRYLMTNSGALNLRCIGGKCCQLFTAMHPDIYIAVVTNPYATRKQLMPILNDFLKNTYP